MDTRGAVGVAFVGKCAVTLRKFHRMNNMPVLARGTLIKDRIIWVVESCFPERCAIKGFGACGLCCTDCALFLSGFRDIILLEL